MVWQNLDKKSGLLYDTEKKMLKNGKIQNIIKVKRSDGKKGLSEQDVKRLTKQMHEKVLKDHGPDFFLKVQTGDIDRLHSFSVDDEGNLMNYKDDYYVGKVAVTDKFEKAQFVYFNIYTF